MYQKYYPKKRYQITLDFLKKYISKSEKILDLGVENPFSLEMKRIGYKVSNTKGEDLDVDISGLLNSDAEVVTAFEIFEHLLSPFTVLRAIKSNKLVASVPLKLWFAKAYRSKTDAWDRHYHEFEDWQFDWLLESRVEYSSLHKVDQSYKKIGIRPLLRWFTTRYYIVYATRNTTF